MCRLDARRPGGRRSATDTPDISSLFLRGTWPKYSFFNFQLCHTVNHFLSKSEKGCLLDNRSYLAMRCAVWGCRNVDRQVDKLLLHFRHSRHPWRSDAGVKPAQGCAPFGGSSTPIPCSSVRDSEYIQLSNMTERDTITPIQILQCAHILKTTRHK